MVEIFGEEPLPGMALALERASLDRVSKSGFDLESRKVLDLYTGKVQIFRVAAGNQNVG